MQVNEQNMFLRIAQAAMSMDGTHDAGNDAPKKLSAPNASFHSEQVISKGRNLLVDGDSYKA